jgi:hypothetical protein
MLRQCERRTIAPDANVGENKPILSLVLLVAYFLQDDDSDPLCEMLTGPSQ